MLDEHKIEVIRETGISSIRVCIDTLNPTHYQLSRNNDKHDVIVANIHKLLKLAPDVQVRFQLMTTNLNPDERPDDFFFAEFGRHDNLSVFYTTAMNLGKEHGLSIIDGDRINPRFCDKLDYEHCIVGWDGTVGLCCPDYWIANRLGNLKEGSISEVYDGMYANCMREMNREGDFSIVPACVNCSMDHMKPQHLELVSGG